MVQQIVTIVNQSGKIVKSSKQLVNVFKEAQVAYNEKKAELRALRQRDEDQRTSESKARKRLEALALADNDDEHSQWNARNSPGHASKQLKRKPVPSRHAEQRPPAAQRGVSDSYYVNDGREAAIETETMSRTSNARFVKHGRAVNDDPVVGELVRRHTDLDLAAPARRRTGLDRRASSDGIDMDLAYGELPPPLPARRGNDTVELREKMTGLQRILEEANCLQHSVTTIIENLAKNPDTMAAVALTLGEISALAAKLAPGALTAMKGSFPAIIALLASPEFAIAGGVALGVTIIAFGGYKIIKKIQARKDENARLLAFGVPQPLTAAESVDELNEINSIESWRRGIADAEADSVATSVDGEFITPIATRTLIGEGKLKPSDLKSSTSSKSRRRRKSSSEAGSKTSSATRTRSKMTSGGRSSRSKKDKPPSRLSMLFSGGSK